MVIRDNEYRLNAREVPVDPLRVKDQLFESQDEHLIRSNHTEEVVIIKSEDGALLSRVSYGYIKSEMRNRYKGRTIFPVVVNMHETLEPLGQVVFEERWLVKVGVNQSVYFFGDKPRCDYFDSFKSENLALIPCKSRRSGDVIQLCVVVQDADEVEELRRLVNFEQNVLFDVKGMRIKIAGNEKVQNYCFCASMYVKEESFKEVRNSIPHVNSIEDVTVWKDLEKDTMIPSTIEAYILNAALFFYYEGYAAINLLMTGKPGCGKSFQMDLFAQLVGTTSTNCEETTLKGLVFSHKSEGEKGRPGVLYRERFVALLNEFVRIVAANRRMVGSEDARRLLSSLNDAVEKKKGRSRSSGLSENSDISMTCSMLTCDNNYETVMYPFVEAMVDDPSYLRRYAFLVLEEETQQRGGEHTKVTDWRMEIERLLQKRHLGGGRWFKLMKYWRKSVKQVLNSVKFIKYRRFADAYKKLKLDEIFGTEASTKELKDLKSMLNEADFSQLAVACVTSVIIMNSTFRRDVPEFPKFTLELEDEQIAVRMIQRLIDDMFVRVKPVIDYRIQAKGVERKTFFN